MFQETKKVIDLSADLIDEVEVLKAKELSDDERAFYLSQLKRTIAILGKTLIYYDTK